MGQAEGDKVNRYDGAGIYVGERSFGSTNGRGYLIADSDHEK